MARIAQDLDAIEMASQILAEGLSPPGKLDVGGPAIGQAAAGGLTFFVLSRTCTGHLNDTTTDTVVSAYQKCLNGD
jgi:hypothetical protein